MSSVECQGCPQKVQINTSNESPKASSYLNLKTVSIAVASLSIVGGLYAASQFGMLDGLKDKVMSLFSSSSSGTGVAAAETATKVAEGAAETVTKVAEGAAETVTKVAEGAAETATKVAEGAAETVKSIVHGQGTCGPSGGFLEVFNNQFDGKLA